MAKYSIADLERLSGVKAHTIRIWEQRYKVLQPQRTETNIRVYGDDQLRVLLNVATLRSQGLKISAIAKMNSKQISDKIDQLLAGEMDTQFEFFVNGLVDAGMEYSEARFEKVFSSAVLRYGVEEMMINIIYPMLSRVGLYWASARIQPTQEHFISNLVKQKLFTAIDASPSTEDSAAESYLLFLPQWEDHEIGLLLAHYLLKRSGSRSIYLGQRVPEESLEEAITQLNPDYLMCFLINSHPIKAIQEYLDMTSSLVGKKCLVSGNPALIKHLDLGNKMEWVPELEGFKEKYLTV